MTGLKLLYLHGNNIASVKGITHQCLENLIIFLRNRKSEKPAKFTVVDTSWKSCRAEAKLSTAYLVDASQLASKPNPTTFVVLIVFFL